MDTYTKEFLNKRRYGECAVKHSIPLCDIAGNRPLHNWVEHQRKVFKEGKMIGDGQECRWLGKKGQLWQENG